MRRVSLSIPLIQTRACDSTQKGEGELGWNMNGATMMRVRLKREDPFFGHKVPSAFRRQTMA